MYNKVSELEISSWNVLSLLRSEVAYIGTGPILPQKRSFVFLIIGVSRVLKLRKAAKTWLDLYNFLSEIENLCGWRLNCPEDIQLSVREM
jgi:hypothetical protein